MMRELWDYFTTRSSQLARKKGYLYQSIALTYRAQRCRAFWDDHIQNCQSLIHDAVVSLKCKNRVLILGSGDLTDIPLNFLLENFLEIYLLDIVHPKAIQKLSKKFPHQVFLVEKDLNETDFNRLIEIKPDLTISANILSQLPLVELENKEKEKKRGDLEISIYKNQIWKNHLKLLQSLPGEVLMYTDISLIYRDTNGKKINEIESCENFMRNTPFKVIKQWIWHLAPKGEINAKFSVDMKILATKIKS